MHYEGPNPRTFHPPLEGTNRVAGNIVWRWGGRVHNRPGRTEEGFTWHGRPVDIDSIGRTSVTWNEIMAWTPFQEAVREIQNRDIAEDPHPGHSRTPTVEQFREALRTRFWQQDPIESRRRAEQRASEFMNQENHNGEAHLPDPVMEAIQACGVSAEEATQAVQQLSRISGFVIERPQSYRETINRLAQTFNFEDDEEVMPDHVRQIDELERERQEARVKEQARLDALPNPWRNPRRKVRV